MDSVKTAYDKVAPTYDDLYDDDLSAAQNAAAAAMLRAAGAHCGGFYADVLDVGCGTGLLLDILPEAAASYYGIDLSAGMILEAQRKHPDAKFKIQDVTKLCHSLNMTSGIVASLFSVMNHLSVAEILGVSLSLTRPGARLFYILRRVALYQAKEGIPAPKIHNLEDVCGVLRSQGFNDVRLCGLTTALELDDFAVIQAVRSRPESA